MKKLISITLALVMLLSVFSVTAYAANNGPLGFSEMMMYYASGISLFDTDGKGSIKTDDGTPMGNYVGVQIFGKDGVNNITGATYDEKSNTLTLTNLNAPDKVLDFAAMGDDFKLEIAGDCSLAAIKGYSAGWSAGLNFTGNGKLTVNADKAFDYGVHINAYYTESPISFGNSVKVDINGKKDAVCVMLSTAKQPFNQFVFTGKCNAKVTAEKVYEERRQFVSGYYIDRSKKPDYVGPNAKCLTDSEGIYVMGDFTSTDSEGNEKKGHWVKKLVYSKSLGLYIEDPAFGDVYLYPGDEDYDNYVSDEGYFYNTEKRYVEAYLDVYTDKNGKEYVCGNVYDDGGSSVVATYEEVSDVKGAYLFTEYKTGEEADEFVKTLTKKPDEWVKIDENTYRNASEINGVFVKELETDTDHLGVQVKSKDDPEGIYFMTYGHRYENWGEENETKIPAHWIRKYAYLEKYNIYLEDNSFEEQTFDYDTIKTSGYTPLVGEFNDEDEYEVHTYNYGNINYIYGYVYENKNGKKYIVDEIRLGDEYVETAFDFEEIPELATSDGKKYMCTIAEGVEVSDLTEVVERTEVEGQSNYYIGVTDFSYTGGSEPAPTEPVSTEPAPTEPKATEPTPTVKPTVKKAANPIKVSAKTVSVKAKKLKTKKQTVKPLTITKQQGKLSVAVVKSGTTKKIRTKVSVNSKGAITLKKGKYAKGTYKVQVKITAKGNSKYKSKTVTKTAKIKIK